jgi:hypothetical protein
LKHFSFSKESFDFGWGFSEYFTISILVLFVIFLSGYLTTLYYISGICYVLFYACYFIILFGLIIILSVFVYDSSSTHYHHWFISIIVMSFLSHHNPFISGIHGIFYGVFIEGSSRFGLDPVWNDIDLPKRLVDFRQNLREDIGKDFILIKRTFNNLF